MVLFTSFIVSFYQALVWLFDIRAVHILFNFTTVRIYYFSTLVSMNMSGKPIANFKINLREF